MAIKTFIRLPLAASFLAAGICFSGRIAPVDKKKDLVRDGFTLSVNRTESKTPRGTIILLPGGDYESVKPKSEGKETARFLNSQSYDVAILGYHVASGPKTRDMALVYSLKAFRLLRTKHDSLGLSGVRLIIMGFSAGGHLAARTVQRMDDNEQPDDLILVSPTYLTEISPGTVYYSVMPPRNPKARLLVTISDKEDKALIDRCQEYSKTWIGYDGTAKFVLSSDSAWVPGTDINPMDKSFNLTRILKSFLVSKAEIKTNTPNPATIPVAGYNSKRHEQKLSLISNRKFDLIMIGNSIINNFEKDEYQPVWNQYFAPRNALNLGYSAYRTENIIWNIQNGELEGQSPKVVIIEIGTNNVDEKNFPTRHTAGELAGGIETIIRLLRGKLPDTKIIVLRCFPGCYGGPNPTSHRAILERASDIVSRLADGKHVYYCDINHVFLNSDGSLNHDMMPDWLHPSPAGAKAWAQAMEPLLSELMGDKSLDTEISTNSAVIPVSKLENDSYDWWTRHSDVLRIKDSINPEIVLIGNSITHFWGGEPKLKYADGSYRKPNGPESWSSLFGNYRVLNLGFGWDRTQNVLWRLDQMAVFPREKSPSDPRRLLINEINLELNRFASDEKITLLDIGKNFLTPDGTFIPGMSSDFCHPTEKGYMVWADALRPVISEEL